MDGSPLSAGDDVAADMPPELMQQLFGGGAGHGLGLPLNPSPSPNLGPACGRGAHLSGAASAPVMLHATSGRAAAEFPPVGAPRFRFAGGGPGMNANLGFAARGASAGAGSSQADSAGASGGTRRSQSLTGPSALGGPGASAETPGGPVARMGTSSPDTPSGGADRGDRSGGGAAGGGRGASARVRTAPERCAGGWGDADRHGSPLQRSTSSNSLQNLGARACPRCLQ